MRLLQERASNQLCCISSLSYCEELFAVTSSDIAAFHLLSQSTRITTATTTLTTPAVLPSRFSAACLHSRQISTPKLRLINCDPSHLSLLSLLSLPPTLAQRPNRLPISYRRARRLGLLQTLALKKTLIHHHRHHQARLLPAIRSPMLPLLRS